ncbi:unnamed protein product, partial [Ixodes hexagonus]
LDTGAENIALSLVASLHLCAGLPEPLPAYHGLFSRQPEGRRPGRDIAHGPHRAGPLCAGPWGPARPAALAEAGVAPHRYGCHGHQPPQAQAGHPHRLHLTAVPIEA